MRKLIVGLMVVSLLAVAAPAMAQIPGSLDPLSLATSGVVLPYVGTPAGESWLEVYAPIFGTSFHMFFFDASCVRQGDSVHLELTTNDVELLRVDNLGNTPTSGLITAASVDGSGFTLQPLFAPVHARVLWANFAANSVRVLEPIALETTDTIFFDEGSWNPMRTAATFFAPLEQPGIVATTLYFICPNTNIIGQQALPNAARAFVINNGFPPLITQPQVPGTPTPLLVRVFDDEERFLRDVRTECECLTARPVAEISPVYADAFSAPFGTFTEVEGGAAPAQAGQAPVCSTTEVEPLAVPGQQNVGNPCPFFTDDPQNFQFVLISPAVPAREAGTFSFTGYRAIRIFDQLEVFGRLSNGWKCEIGDNFTQACFDSASNFR